MKPALIPCALIILLGLTATSCKKGGEDGGTCRIATVHIRNTGNGMDATTKITYDSIGRIKGTLATGTSSLLRTFTYKGDSTLIRETNGTVLTDYKAVRNGAGNLKYLIAYKPNSTDLAFTVRYDYNPAGKTFSKTVTYYPGGETSSTQSYNAAGDAISSKITTSTTAGTTYDYYTSQDFQTGDLNAIDDYIHYGAHAVTNAHLRSKETLATPTAGNLVTTYVYSYGDGGRITSAVLTIGTSTPFNYDYTYSCN